MSIFRDTFQPEIKQSLEFRQKAMTNRTPQVIQYMNSRNSWIKMTSTINVDGTNILASQYVLQGGVLNPNNTLKSGIGNSNTDSYSTVSPSGKKHRLGIRPIPGITSLSAKSKSAYGSLREVTVKFQCWDIKQLEDLEILYMRPGYTVLVEWGWVPYFDEKETYQPTFTNFYSDDILNPKTTNVTTILNELYKKSVKAGGNYDAIYGYIKNYEWSAREDGGYDCSTTIISIGEMAESLKLNYIRTDLDKLYEPKSVGIGLLDELFDAQGTNKSILFASYYQKNILAGIWAELALKIKDPNIKPEQMSSDLIKDKWGVIEFPGLKNYGSFDTFIQPGSSIKSYITLESAFDIINKFALIQAKPSNVPLIKLSTKAETYSGKGGGDLLCVAHPLQVSIDPTVCLIKNSLWYEEIAPAISGSVADLTTTATLTTSLPGQVGGGVPVAGGKNVIMGDSQTPSIKANSQLLDPLTSEGVLWKVGWRLRDLSAALSSYPGNNEATKVFINIGTNDGYTPTTDIPKFIGLVKQKFPNATLYVIEGSTGWGNLVNIPTSRIASYYKQFTDLGVIKLQNALGASTDGKHPNQRTPGIVAVGKEIDGIIGGTVTPPAAGGAVGGVATTTSTTTVTQFSVNDAVASIQVLKKLKKDFFYENDPSRELGTIGNIYVSLDFLYRQSLSPSLESGDNKEKNEIDLFKYVKSIASGIQVALGNINSFEVHVDPIDNTARIVDINYAVPTKPSDLFTLKIQNTNSIVRSYKIQSQIFPNQSALITMGSQPPSKGRGVQGTQNNTLLDFNNGLSDRIIKDKEDPKRNSLLQNNVKEPNLAYNVANIIVLLGILGRQVPEGAVNNVNIGELVSKAKNSLRDVIVYFQSLPKIVSPGRNRGILPLKYSFTMDGIGGLVIGSLFKVEDKFIPKGYKGEKNVGAELVQTISGISHEISNGDWTTTIEALNAIINRPDKGNFLDYKKNITEQIREAVKVIIEAGAGISELPSANITLIGLGSGVGSAPSGVAAPVEKYSPYNYKHGATHVVNSIILHCTAGFGDARSTHNTLVKRGVSCHYAIGRLGDTVVGIDEDKIAYHANNKCKGSIGIELCNVHDGIRSKSDPSKIVCKQFIKKEETPLPSDIGSAGWVDFGFEWDRSQIYENYTDAQMVALESLIRGILSRHPGIKLNFTKDITSIYRNVWGFTTLDGKPITGPPQPGGKYTSTKPNGGIGVTSSEPGIYIHRICQSATHADTHPALKLVQLLQRIAPA